MKKLVAMEIQCSCGQGLELNEAQLSGEYGISESASYGRDGSKLNARFWHEDLDQLNIDGWDLM